MELTAVKRLRCTLTLHFAVIACLTAMLVAAGSQSYFLPILIFFVSVAAYVFVDRLEWFELGRIGSYIGMLAATAFSIGSYLYNAFSVPSESGQLLAIAGLLVYPEAVLFLQAKNLRVYEQLAVFLLLEMIVAALVNDNILFGVLLAPIMLLWVSALFLFSRYATLIQIDPSLEKPVPILFELLMQRFRKSFMSTAKKPSVVTCHASLFDVQASRGMRRTLQSFPIGLGAVMFAGFFFYLLPRTTPTGFEPSLGFETRVGLPKTLSIGKVGRLLSDPTPVMRVSLTNFTTRQTYVLREPPYIRARVMETYGGAERGYSGADYGEWVFGGIHEYRRLRGLESTQVYKEQGRDVVNVEFDIRRRFANTMYNIPPAFASQPPQELRLSYDHFNMVLEDIDHAKLPRGKSLVYSIGSIDFADQNQLRIVPSSIGTGSFAHNRNLYNVMRPFRNFEICNRYRQELLDTAPIDKNSPFAIASYIEQHFGNGDFAYSLDLKAPVDPEMDPMEDFLINQRRGHCQYFASAMVMMLRQSEIPSRIVVGYKPVEFNKIGNYFPVRQSDAHAWVEALFLHDDLVGTELEKWLTDSESYWVRFDPTAMVEGEAIIEQQGQAMDYAEKLWKDYVVEGQKLAGDNTLYAPVAANSKNAYDQAAESLRNLRTNLEQGNFFTTAAGIGFAWQLTFLIIGGGILLIAVWRIIVVLPRWAPRLAKKLGIVREPASVQQAFYARCLSMLKQLGFTRELHETPDEFTRRASAALAASSLAPPSSLPQSLQLVTQVYYRLRFGHDSQLTPGEQDDIQRALDELAAVSNKRS